MKKKIFDNLNYLCKSSWIIVLIILAISIIIYETYILLWITGLYNATDIIIMVANSIMAICAVVALTGWKKELKKKRQFDVIDELLALIIKVQIFLKEDFLFYRIGLPDCELKEENYPRINRKAILYGKNFDLLYSKCMTVGLNLFAEKIQNLSKKFYYSVKKNDGTYTGFYEECKRTDSNFKDSLLNSLLELKRLCEEKIYI